MLRQTRRFLVAAALTAPLAFAASEPATEVEEAEPFPILTATCGDIYDLFEDAKPGDDIDPKDVAEAQDDVLYFVTWVHGYLTGRYGFDMEKRNARPSSAPIVNRSNAPSAVPSSAQSAALTWPEPSISTAVSATGITDVTANVKTAAIVAGTQPVPPLRSAPSERSSSMPSTTTTIDRLW